MPAKERMEFLEWYESVKDQTFNFKKEMFDYIRDDVTILRRSAMLFRDLIKQITGEKGDPIDPFHQVTLGK